MSEGENYECLKKVDETYTNVFFLILCFIFSRFFPYFFLYLQAGVCPFHYNHWSCDGMKGGGRDHERAGRCRCKVSFDLVNFMTYHPVINR